MRKARPKLEGKVAYSDLLKGKQVGLNNYTKRTIVLEYDNELPKSTVAILNALKAKAQAALSEEDFKQFLENKGTFMYKTKEGKTRISLVSAHPIPVYTDKGQVKDVKRIREGTDVQIAFSAKISAKRTTGKLQGHCLNLYASWVKVANENSCITGEDEVNTDDIDLSFSEAAPAKGTDVSTDNLVSDSSNEDGSVDWF